jgi:hypothetical protein
VKLEKHLKSCSSKFEKIYHSTRKKMTWKTILKKDKLSTLSYRIYQFETFNNFKSKEINVRTYFLFCFRYEKSNIYILYEVAFKLLLVISHYWNQYQHFLRKLPQRFINLMRASPSVISAFNSHYFIISICQDNAHIGIITSILHYFLK